jgi:hypothetical protein
MLSDRKDPLDELEFVGRVREPVLVSKGDDVALHVQWKKQRGKLMGAGTNQRNRVTASSSCDSVEGRSGRDEKDSKPSLVTGSDAPMGSHPHQEDVQEEGAHGEIPSGWKVLFSLAEGSSRELMSMRSKKQ